MEYTLENEFLAVKVSTTGGVLTSIRSKDGLEYLWQGDPAYWANQAPLLFPICGSIRDNQASVGDGRQTKMPRHGIVRGREFDCVQQSMHSVTMAIVSDDEMMEQFPFAARLAVTYTLEGHTLTQTFTVENLEEEEMMPFFVGGHPAFNCPMVEGDAYTDYYVEFEQEETCSVPEQLTDTGLLNLQNRTDFLKGTKRLPLSFDLFAKDAITFDELKSRSVKLASDKHGHSVTMEFAEFPYFILWTTANKGPFLAMEPWLGLSTCSDESDQLEEKRGVQIAAPGESKSYSFQMTFA
ncbi:aldose 1-epimerase family protein [Lachnospiraceae bacterium 47-T17]